MKRPSFLRLRLSIFTLLLSVCIWPHHSNGQSVSWTQEGSYHNRFTFSISNWSADQGDYTFFWNFGDGTFATIGNNTGAEITHTYIGATGGQTFTPVVEYTYAEEYEDDPPPKSRVVSDYNSSNDHLNIDEELEIPSNPNLYTIPNSLLENLSSNALFNITASREPVIFEPEGGPNEGDIISYAFQYQNPCDTTFTDDIALQFKFSKAVLIKDNDTDFSAIANSKVESLGSPAVEFHWVGRNNEGDPTLSSTASDYILTWKVNGADFKYGKQHTVFIFFRVDENTTKENLVVSGHLAPFNEPESDLEFNTCTVTTPAPLEKKISHDPNFQYANVNEPTCFSSTQSKDEITYTVRFQNIGTGPTQDIKIKTWLDSRIDFNGVPTEIIYPPAPNFTTSKFELKSSNYDPNDHALEFWLCKAELNGTGEKGYLTTIMEHQTYDSIVFKVRLRQDFVNDCSTIFSRSEITFDCNPSIITNLVQTPVGCLDSPGANCVCNQIAPIRTIPAPTSGYQVGNTLQLSAAALKDFTQSKSASSQSLSYYWFPSEGLSNPRLPNPTIEQLDNPSLRNYYLVLSDMNTCEKRIYRFPIPYAECSLDVSILPSCSSSDHSLSILISGGEPPYYITDDTGQAMCSAEDWFCKEITGTHLITGIPAGQDQVLIGIKDSKGCSLTKTVKFPFQPLQVGKRIKDCIVSLDIEGGKPPYFITWPNSSTPVAANSTYELPEHSVSGIAMVSDDAGCTVSVDLSEDAPCFKRTVISWSFYLAIGVVVVIGIALAAKALSNKGGG